MSLTLRDYLHKRALEQFKAWIYKGCGYPSDIIDFLEGNDLKGMDWMEKRNPSIKVGNCWKRRDDCIEVNGTLTKKTSFFMCFFVLYYAEIYNWRRKGNYAWAIWGKG